MTTDDAPRPALDARAVERLRERYMPGPAPRCRECGGEMFPDSEPHYDRAAQCLVRFWYCPIVYRAPGQPGMGGTLLHGRLGRDVVWEGDPDALALLDALLSAAAERDALAEEVSILRFALLRTGGLAGKHRRAGCPDEDGAIAAIQDAVIEAVESTWSGPALAPAAGEGMGDGARD